MVYILKSLLLRWFFIMLPNGLAMRRATLGAWAL